MTARFEDGFTVTVATSVPSKSLLRRASRREAMLACVMEIEGRHEGAYEILSVSTPTSILRDLTTDKDEGTTIIGRERSDLARLKRPRMVIGPWTSERKKRNDGYRKRRRVL